MVCGIVSICMGDTDTHAQKYFQKLAKARQNGGEGDISMEGRGRVVGSTVQSWVGSLGNINGALTQCSKRHREATETKRKGISGIVSNTQQEGKRLATELTAPGASPALPPLPVLTPVLAPYMVPSPVHPHVPPSQPTHLSQHPNPGTSSPSAVITSVPTSKLCISGPALEDSLTLQRRVHLRCLRDWCSLDSMSNNWHPYNRILWACSSSTTHSLISAS